MGAAVLALLLTAWIAAGTPWSDCPPAEDWLAGEHSDRQTRKEHRVRAHAAWKSLGIPREQVAAMEAIAWRESRWDACAGGNQVKFHLRHWPGKLEDMRVPEVSALIIARVVLRTVRLYGCRSWLCVGRIYGGGGIMDRDPWRIRRWCELLEERGVDCKGPAKVADVGVKPQGWERAWLRKLNLRRWLGL